MLVTAPLSRAEMGCEMDMIEQTQAQAPSARIGKPSCLYPLPGFHRRDSAVRFRYRCKRALAILFIIRTIGRLFLPPSEPIPFSQPDIPAIDPKIRLSDLLRIVTFADD